MENTLFQWATTQGPFAVGVVVLGWVIRELWKSKELSIGRREEDIKTLYQALNTNTNALQDQAELTEKNTAATKELAQLSAARAVAFEEFTRRFDEFARRTDAALQRNPR